MQVQTMFCGKQIQARFFDDDPQKFWDFRRAARQPFGQVSPLTALGVTDLVNKVSGLPKLTPSKPQTIYRDVMAPDRSIVYIAAIVRDAISAALHRRRRGIRSSGRFARGVGSLHP